MLILCICARLSPCTYRIITKKFPEVILLSWFLFLVDIDHNSHLLQVVQLINIESETLVLDPQVLAIRWKSEIKCRGAPLLASTATATTCQQKLFRGPGKASVIASLVSYIFQSIFAHLGSTKNQTVTKWAQDSLALHQEPPKKVFVGNKQQRITRCHLTVWLGLFLLGTRWCVSVCFSLRHPVLATCALPSPWDGSSGCPQNPHVFHNLTQHLTVSLHLCVAWLPLSWTKRGCLNIYFKSHL